MHRRLAAAATLCATLLLAACTQHAPQPPPPPASGPKMPSDAPSSAAPSPSPTPSPSPDSDAVARAAAERAYRTQFAEFNRLEMAGGATHATKTLADSATGKNLQHLLTWLKEDKQTGQRQVNPARLAGVGGGQGNARRRSVTACEDYSKVKWTRHGKPFRPGGASRILQHAIVLKGSDGKWRVALVDSTAVKSFSKASCGGGA